MNIIKEEGKIILELTKEEDRIIKYFLEKRGSNFLNEYFVHFMETRRGVREDEISTELYKKWREEESGKLE